MLPCADACAQTHWEDQAVPDSAASLLPPSIHTALFHFTFTIVIGTLLYIVIKTKTTINQYNHHICHYISCIYASFWTVFIIIAFK